MKNFKKYFIIILLVLSFLLVLAACDEENPDTPVEQPPIVEDETDDNGDISGTVNDKKEEEPLNNTFFFELNADKLTYTLTNCHLYDGEVEIPSTFLSKPVVAIGSGAFHSNDVIEEVYIPSSIKTIGDRAFALTVNLKTVTFLSGSALDSIGERAFFEADKLSAINIPESVKSIGAEAFKGCLDLTQLVVPEGVERLGKDALDCTYYRNLTNTGVIYVGKVAYAFNPIEEQPLTAVTIEEGTLSIADGAFYGNEYITALSLPSTVNHVGEGAFSGIKNLQSLNVASANAIYYSAQNGIYEKATKKLLFTSKNTVIASDTLVIGSGAFEQSQITGTVVIPDSVTTIEEGAFKEANITGVTLSNQISVIEKNVFLDCINLESITVPSSVKEIKNGAFNGCVSLKTVVIDSVDIASAQHLKLDNGTLMQYAETVYLKEGLGKLSAYINAFGTVQERDKDGYIKYKVL